jgi:hypothetical protein
MTTKQRFLDNFGDGEWYEVHDTASFLSKNTETDADYTMTYDDYMIAAELLLGELEQDGRIEYGSVTVDNGAPDEYGDWQPLFMEVEGFRVVSR